MHDHVNSTDFHQTVSLLREFFLKKGFIEAHTQNRLSILAACEDPFNIATFDYQGERWPLPQTNQMWLEYELLKNPLLEGIFCISTSYRQEKNPIPGRHNLIFPMFEFEAKGSQNDLMQLEKELCQYLGFGSMDDFKSISYEEVMNKYNVRDVDDEEEEALAKDYGNVILLHDFPFHTSPFWNMRYNEETKTAYKVDVLIHGMETIGSAERSCDPNQMHQQFHTISEGKYAEVLFDKFGKDRVLKELDEFLNFNFFPRYGGGIGLTRMIRGLQLEGLIQLPETEMKLAS